MKNGSSDFAAGGAGGLAFSAGSGFGGASARSRRSSRSPTAVASPSSPAQVIDGEPCKCPLYGHPPAPVWVVRNRFSIRPRAASAATPCRRATHVPRMPNCVFELSSPCGRSRNAANRAAYFSTSAWSFPAAAGRAGAAGVAGFGSAAGRAPARSSAFSKAARNAVVSVWSTPPQL